MIPAKEKAEELINKFCLPHLSYIDAKQCAILCVENEYKSLREQLFNLKSCKVIQSDKVYLYRLQVLIDEEKEIKNYLEQF